MGLSIFSFDLAAIINSMSGFDEIIEDISDINLPSENSSKPAAEMFASVGETSASAIVEGILLAGSVSSMTAVSPDDLVKKEIAAAPGVLPKPTIRSKAPTPEVQQAIEQLIKSLQTSVAFAYQSTDLINQRFSHNHITNTSQRQAMNNLEKKQIISEKDEKNREGKRKELENQLRKAILRNEAKGKLV